MRLMDLAEQQENIKIHFNERCTSIDRANLQAYFENSETKNEKSEDVSEDPLDPIKLMKVAVSLDQKPWKKPLDKNLIE